MTMKRLLCSLLVLVSGFGGGHLFFVVDALSSVLTPTLGRSTTPTTSQRSSTDTKDQTQQHCPLLDEWREYDLFRGSNLETEELEPFFKARPLVIVNRLLQVSTTLWQARRDWEATAPAADGDTNIFADTDKEKGMVVDTRSERENQLCAAISSLGPVAVKVGQTLSQRPDIVGHEACKALVRLQTKNLPYDNDLAYAVIRESLNWEGPIAPGIGADLPGQPLFANMTADPVACASLGQVYKAETWEGQFVAVKVQRPDAMAVLAKDLQCFRTVFKVREQVQLLLGGQSSATANSKQNVGSVIDRVGRDILDEIDYTIEAANSAEFRESLAFLGFVTTPDFVPKYSSKRVLVTEWIAGNHLEYLDKTNGLAMTRMAVEACTASMVLTGLVHADPHEGNLMLHDDGRVVFLDFGLMSRVDQGIMEGFARGIQALLSEDWRTLTEAFVDVGFVTVPIMHRNGANETWGVDPNYGIDELAEQLAAAMENTEGGKARFGSLATVLNKKISPNWLVYTPPYVLLLIRTFLTLEGIAAKLDPDFNIYEMAMPWAVRRSLSPSTEKGIEVFRSAIMTSDNRIQWARVLELASKSGSNAPEEAVLPAEIQAKRARNEAAKKAAMNDAVLSLLGAPEGKALRRALRDLDSTDLLKKLSSKDGQVLVTKAIEAATGSSKSKNSSSKDLAAAADLRPVSDDCLELREKQGRRKRKIGRMLIVGHLRRQLSWKGLRSFTRLSFVCLRVAISMMAKKLLGFLRLRKTDEDADADTTVPVIP